MALEAFNLNDVETCVDQIIAEVGKNIVLGVPLALGKPNQLINALYKRAKSDSTLSLRIITALSLEKPAPKNDIEARLLTPFIDRLFGDYEALEYMRDIRADTIPENITISEFYFKAGAMKDIPSAQRNYISTNYTFVARDLIDNGVNVLAQLVAEKKIDGHQQLSLSCNTDVTLDIKPLLETLKDEGRKVLMIAQVHDALPFMYNRAMVPPQFFDIIIKNPNYNTRLFAPPNLAVSPQDYHMGLQVSTLLKDGGTLQIGIGALGDAIVYATQLRHRNNADYQKCIKTLNTNAILIEQTGGLTPFEQGLYGSSEMFVNGFRHLIESGIIKRKVYDNLALQRLLNAGKITEAVSTDTLRSLIEAGTIPRVLRQEDLHYLQHWGILTDTVTLCGDSLHIGSAQVPNDLADTATVDALTKAGLGTALKHGIIMHGGFFLGPQDFYAYLRNMPHEAALQICMSSVGHINQLDQDIPLLTAQRRHARFVNSAMMVTLSGAVVSDGLEDGTVISGVGGQYNFVAMAHQLPQARSILCVRSTRGHGKHTQSNIVAEYGHTTIPRHLRDIIVTEYGVADLRGKTDENIVIELVKIADSRFQDELLEISIATGKLDPNYILPEQHRQNTPEQLAQRLTPWQKAGYFPKFPFGTDFTDEEIALGASLKDIKALMDNPGQLIKAIVRSFVQDVDHERAQKYLERMQLAHPDTAKETLIQHLLLLELADNGYLRSI